MKTLPSNAVAYKRTPLFTSENTPEALLHDHRTKAGTWGLIQVERGTLQYIIEDKETHILKPGSPGVVEPQVTHFVTLQADAAFYVEFYREQ